MSRHHHRRHHRHSRPLIQSLESRTLLAVDLPLNINFGPNATPVAADMDSSGNVWVAGTFQGQLDVNPSPRKTHLLNSSTGSFFIVRYDSLGRPTFADNFDAEPGSTISIGDLKADKDGNAVIVGSLTGSMDFNLDRGVFYRTTRSPSTDLPANQDVFIWRMNKGGGLISAVLTSHNFSSIETADHLALDSSSNLYIAGTYNENTDDTIVRAYAAKFSPTGSIAFFQTLSDQLPSAIAINNNNKEVYVAAHAGATVDTPIKINRFSNTGRVISSLAFTEGTPTSIDVTGIAFDSDDNVVLTGNLTGAADFNPGAGTYAFTSDSGTQDIFVAKYRTNSAPRFAFLVGGGGIDTAGGIAVNRRDDSITLGGSFAGAVDFAPSPRKNFTIDTGDTAVSDLFLAHYNSGGKLLDADNAGLTGPSDTALAFAFTPSRAMIAGLADFGLGETGVAIYQDLLA